MKRQNFPYTLYGVRFSDTHAPCGGACLNMMGFIHSLRSPEGILRPKVRV